VEALVSQYGGFKTLRQRGQSFVDYITALRAAVEFKEKCGDRDWLFNEEGKRYRYSEADMEVFLGQVKRAEMMGDGAAASGPAPMEVDNRAALKKLARDARASRGDEDEIEYTSSGRPRKKRPAWQLGSDEDDGDSEGSDFEGAAAREKKRPVLSLTKKRKVEKAHPSKPRPTQGTSASAPKPLSLDKKGMSIKTWNQYTQSIKAIMGGTDARKKATYQVKLLQNCDDFVTSKFAEQQQHQRRVEELTRELHRAEEKRDSCKAELDQVGADVRNVLASTIASESDYTKEILFETKFPKTVMKFTKKHRNFLGSSQPNLLRDMKVLVGKWKQRFAGKSEAKKDVTLSPCEGDTKREELAELLSLRFGRDKYDMMIGRNLEEQVFNRHGLEGRRQYLSDMKVVYTSLQDDGLNPTTHLKDIGEGRLSIQDFLAKVLQPQQ